MENTQDHTSGITPQLKRGMAIALVILLGLLAVDRLAQAGITWQNLYHWQNPIQTNDTISVMGEGRVTVVPDVAEVSVSVESRGKSVTTVRNDGTKKMNDVINYLKSQDIDKKDIRTVQYSLQPLYTYNPRDGRQTLDGYMLNQTSMVKIRALDKAGDILGGVLDKGANQVGQLNFTMDDPEKSQQEARLEAVEKAKTKAEALAKAAGVRLGKLKAFNENGGNMPYPLMYDKVYAAEGRGGANMSAPQLEPGSQEIVINVSLVYEIE